ncbi:hypothetical protein PENTCL1PPCAC_24687, partial [Pristionchus entomophagus]
SFLKNSTTMSQWSSTEGRRPHGSGMRLQVSSQPSSSSECAAVCASAACRAESSHKLQHRADTATTRREDIQSKETSIQPKGDTQPKSSTEHRQKMRVNPELTF